MFPCVRSVLFVCFCCLILRFSFNAGFRNLIMKFPDFCMSLCMCMCLSMCLSYLEFAELQGSMGLQLSLSVTKLRFLKKCLFIPNTCVLRLQTQACQLSWCCTTGKHQPSSLFCTSFWIDFYQYFFKFNDFFPVLSNLLLSHSVKFSFQIL